MKKETANENANIEQTGAEFALDFALDSVLCFEAGLNIEISAEVCALSSAYMSVCVRAWVQKSGENWRFSTQKLIFRCFIGPH